MPFLHHFADGHVAETFLAGLPVEGTTLEKFFPEPTKWKLLLAFFRLFLQEENSLRAKPNIDSASEIAHHEPETCQRAEASLTINAQKMDAPENFPLSRSAQA